MVPALLLAGIFGVALWSRSNDAPWYAITPGIAQPVGPFITVPGTHAARRDSIDLTDVYVTPLSYWQYWMDELHLPSDTQLYPAADIEDGSPASQLVPQGYQEMADAQTFAKVAALRALHLEVAATPDGAEVTQILSSTTALGRIGVADRIVEIDGRSVRSACQYFSALVGVRPGATVVVDDIPAAISKQGAITYGEVRAIDVRAGVAPGSLESAWNDPSAGLPWGVCAGVASPSAWLGIVPENDDAWRFPLQVTVHTEDIGGPSAGLAMALGIVDALSKVGITGSLRIAATGTIAPNGVVGEVGGVPEKTIAVERAGATVFFVPKGNEQDAISKASRSLRVVAVTSLGQVLAWLEAHGGAAPMLATGSSAASHTS